ncbi:transcriptional regulator, AlpA family [Mariprofundus ferrinatatus]|uniref:Transcriptional regulator, AlpA family n=1 Tax=Mariprofundus ferrinatatus TaxID=1921087 RepID=A0A2K8L9U2_9PROT|nr:transcriptional regulator, AlpA family [Mariprofundus ferrinatatus]
MKVDVNDIEGLRLLRIDSVLALLPIARSSWYRGIQDGRYPKPVKISSRSSAWRSSDIKELIEQLGNEN